MFLFWRIRYLDTQKKEFKDRDLYLATNSLEPAMKTSVELLLELKELEPKRSMLKYRHLFREANYSDEEKHDLIRQNKGMSSFILEDYFEDENGNEITFKQMAVLLTGDPNAVIYPYGFKKHDIAYTESKKPSICTEEIQLTDKEINLLGYFTRDIREMQSSALMKEGPGSLSSTINDELIIRTAVTDEEIRSFVTIFRRLYMINEPASFLKAADLYSRVLREHPLGTWVKAAAKEYEQDLSKKPDFLPFATKKSLSFTRKQLIDVFIYTQYAHQPDANRIRQFEKYLLAMDNKKPILTYLFLEEIWGCSWKILSAGNVIAGFFDKYCKFHNLCPKLLASISKEHPGIGSLEKRVERKRRILNEKAKELAKDIWEKNGSPSGGPEQYFQEASEILKKTLEH